MKQTIKAFIKPVADNWQIIIVSALLIFIIGILGFQIPDEILLNSFYSLFLINFFILLIWFLKSNLSINSKAFAFFRGYIIIIATLAIGWFAIVNYNEDRLIEYVKTNVEYHEKCFENKNTEICKLYEFKLAEYSDLNKSFRKYIKENKINSVSTNDLLIRFACSISIMLLCVLFYIDFNYINEIKQEIEKE